MPTLTLTLTQTSSAARGGEARAADEPQDGGV